MKVLALTGTNLAAQAQACELVLDQTRRAGLCVIVAQGCDCQEHFEALSRNAHLVEVWLIGQDTVNPAIDHLVDAQIPADPVAMPAAVLQQLLTFSFKAANRPAAASPHLEPTP